MDEKGDVHIIALIVVVAVLYFAYAYIGPSIKNEVAKANANQSQGSDFFGDLKKSFAQFRPHPRKKNNDYADSRGQKHRSSRKQSKHEKEESAGAGELDQRMSALKERLNQH